jgi:plasmid maintenance system antidote protein VapI
MSIFDKLFKRKHKLYAFDPDYIVPPSEIIREAMEHAGISRDDLFNANPYIELTAFNNMMADITPINDELAKKLSNKLGGEPEFWVALSKKYFDALKLKGGE